MPSWIKEQDGLEWYDEWFTMRETNQKPAQLHKKVAAGSLRSLPGKGGKPGWYARPDVEDLRAAFLARKEKAKKRKPSAKQLEAKYARQAKELAEGSRRGRGGPVTAHYEKSMIAGIFVDEAKKKKSDK